MHPIFLHYPIQVPYKQISETPYPTYSDQEYYYFVIPTAISDQAVLEQNSVVTHYHSHQWLQIVCPLKNVHNQWVTQIGKEQFLLCYAKKAPDNNQLGRLLATFHQIGFEYPYEPRSISCYGQWKELWIQKLDQYEAMYKNLYQKRPVTSFMREYFDVFPYIIGLSENAIQYLNIVEKESRFNQADQGTITFRRYRSQVNQPFIFANQLAYDHPARDIAEVLRPYMLMENGLDVEECKLWLQEYLSVQPLSIFGWKLLYARLIFPTHLFDLVDQLSEQDGGGQTFLETLNKQVYYEENLRQFFYTLGIDLREANVIQLDWLS